MGQTQTKPVVQPDIFLDENGNEILLDENGNPIKPPTSGGRGGGAGPNTGIKPGGGMTVAPSATKMGPQLTGFERFDNLNKPLVDTGKYARKLSETMTDPRNRIFKDENSFGRSIEDAVRGYAGGAYEGVANLLDEQSRPSNLALLGVGGMENAAAESGWESVTPFLTKARQVLSAPVAIQGGINTFGSDKSIGDRLTGVGEMLMGGGGMFAPTPSMGRTNEPTPVEQRTSPRINGEGVTPPKDWNEVSQRATSLLGEDVSKLNSKQLLAKLVMINPNEDQEVGYLANSVGRMIRSGEAPSIETGPRMGQLDVADELRGRTVGEHRGDVSNAVLEQTAGDILLDENGKLINPPTEPNIPINRTVGNNGIPPNNAGGPPNMGGGTPGGPTGPSGNPPPAGVPAPQPMPVPPANSPLSAREGLYRKVSGTIRSILTSYDLSALKQGKGLITHPEYWTNIRTMMKAWGSERALKDIHASIEGDVSGLFSKSIKKPDGRFVSIAEDAGLDLTDHSVTERWSSKFAGHLPGVKASQRAFEGYILKLRADVFKKLYTEAQGLGRGNLDVAKQIADLVNTATGTTKLGGLEKSQRAMQILNETFFAPRYNASRVKMYTQVLNPKLYLKYDPIVRREAIRSLLGVVGSGMLIGELGRMAGAEVSNDPTSSDFRKIKIGNTRIDNFAGLQQFAVAATRFLSGESTSSNTGETFDLANPKFGGQTRASVVENLMTSKLAPIPSFIWGWMQTKEFDGTPFEVKRAMVTRIAPIVMQDIYSLYQENPAAFPPGFLAAIMGEGTATYGR